MDSSIIQTIAVYALPVLLAITLHEAAHGYVARMYGDNTALLAGRITLNPARHIDPVGTVLVPIAILLTSHFAGVGAFLFGWAKPVPVNFGNLRNPKKDIEKRHSLCRVRGSRGQLPDGTGMGTYPETSVHAGLQRAFFC
jgi:Zn-dependent protease